MSAGIAGVHPKARLLTATFSLPLLASKGHFFPRTSGGFYSVTLCLPIPAPPAIFLEKSHVYFLSALACPGWKRLCGLKVPYLWNVKPWEEEGSWNSSAFSPPPGCPAGWPPGPVWLHWERWPGGGTSPGNLRLCGSGVQGLSCCTHKVPVTLVGPAERGPVFAPA